MSRNNSFEQETKQESTTTTKFCIGVISCLKIFHHDIFSTEFPWWTLCVEIVCLPIPLSHSILFSFLLLFILLFRKCVYGGCLNNIPTAYVQWRKFSLVLKVKVYCLATLKRKNFMKRQICYLVFKNFRQTCRKDSQLRQMWVTRVIFFFSFLNYSNLMKD